MSRLVKHGIQFSAIEVKIDPDGRYIFLLCSLYRIKCILAGVYIPPPFSTGLLQTLADFLSRWRAALGHGRF